MTKKKAIIYRKVMSEPLLFYKRLETGHGITSHWLCCATQVYKKRLYIIHTLEMGRVEDTVKCAHVRAHAHTRAHTHTHTHTHTQLNTITLKQMYHGTS